jgi:hypothetical protein
MADEAQSPGGEYAVARTTEANANVRTEGKTHDEAKEEPQHEVGEMTAIESKLFGVLMSQQFAF